MATAQKKTQNVTKNVPQLSSANNPRPQTKQKGSINAKQRHEMISEAAYLLAEKRGFHGDSSMDDWLQAEADIDAKYMAKM